MEIPVLTDFGVCLRLNSGRSMYSSCVLSAFPLLGLMEIPVLTDFGVCLRMELWACCSTRQDGFELLVDGARRASGID